MGGGRGQKDEVPSPLAHRGEKCLRAMQSREDIALKHFAPPGRICLGDPINSDSSAGVIHQRINGAAFQDVRNHLFHLRVVAQISYPILATNLIGKGL